MTQSPDSPKSVASATEEGAQQKEDEASELPTGTRFNNFLALYVIGQGRGGGRAYSAIESQQDLTEGMMAFVRPTVVIKYPVRDPKELQIMQLLTRHRCPGVPRVHDSGYLDGKLWIVLDILGKPFHEIADLGSIPLERRWQIVQVLGRMLLRRLQALHARGFVHCDVQPENILMEQPEASSISQDTGKPFFIDFGLAQRFPDGPCMPSHWGTLEYSSIMTAEGGMRLPIDDVESLGWVLCYYTAGDLPWFSLIKSGDWDNKEWRTNLISKVHDAKVKSLGDGPESLTKLMPDAPEEIFEYLRLCRRLCKSDSPLDYVPFYKLLGWKSETSDLLAETWDFTVFRRLCEVPTRSSDGFSDPYELARKDFAKSEQEFQALNGKYFVSGSWSNWEMQRMTKDKTDQMAHVFEVHLPQDECSFQIVRNRDLKQVYSPTRPNAGGANMNPVRGPDKNDDGFHWDLPGEAGDVCMIRFDAAKLNITISKSNSRPLPAEILATLPESKYFVVGSWDKWKHMHNMTCFGNRHVMTITVGARGYESFQIIYEKDWNKRLHPNVKNANPFVVHELKGPSRHGAGYNWKIGAHALDWAGAGSLFQIQLLTRAEMPVKVEWKRI